jgi:hypothetical protein
VEDGLAAAAGLLAEAIVVVVVEELRSGAVEQRALAVERGDVLGGLAAALVIAVGRALDVACVVVRSRLSKVYVLVTGTPWGLVVSLTTAEGEDFWVRLPAGS